MGRHHISLSPDRSIVIIAVSGARDTSTYSQSTPDFLEFFLAQPARKVLFDTRLAHAAIDSSKAMDLAEACGRQMPASRIAIVAREFDCAYARVWRRGLSATGHESFVFESVAEADAWLRSEADEDTLYVA
ncbi:MAG: hypothetical protein ACXIVO_05770 [Glycocaulis sp.]|uniref:hypothetical protein n=1 Tax=Glycocaulis sp. TaxID=1969725 RepID=UPI003F6F5FA2